jgi:hypothetical protein
MKVADLVYGGQSTSAHAGVFTVGADFIVRLDTQDKAIARPRLAENTFIRRMPNRIHQTRKRFEKAFRLLALVSEGTCSFVDDAQQVSLRIDAVYRDVPSRFLKDPK